MNRKYSDVLDKYLEYLPHFVRKNKQSIAYFLLVGIVTLLIYIICFALCLELLHLNYRVAVSLAYFIAILFHFNVNRIFTFNSSGHNLREHIVKYIGLLIINYLLTILIMHIVVADLSISPYVGIVLAPTVNIVSNYLLSHFWVFKKNSLESTYHS